MTNETPLSSPTLPCDPAEVDEFLSRPTPAVLETLARTPGPVLILGAGGKLGLHVSLMVQAAFRALRRKDAVIAVSRFQTLRDQEEFHRRGVTTIACDLEDSAALARLPDAPTVIFLAGVKFGTAAAPDLLRRMNVEMPQRVAGRFRNSRIVAFSTGCVYPFVPVASGGATEDTPVAPPGDYAQSCLAREEAFAEVAARHGTPVVLIRLNYAVEFRYGVLVDVAQKVLARQPIDVTTGHFNVIWQRDAVVHSLQALDLAAAPAVPLNITGPETLTLRDMATRFGERFGIAPTFQGAEASTAWLNNAAKSHRRFGPPPTSVADMIAWIAAWMTQGGASWGKPTGFESRSGKF